MKRGKGWEGQSEVSCYVPFLRKNTPVNYTVLGASSLSLSLPPWPASSDSNLHLFGFATENQRGVRDVSEVKFFVLLFVLSKLLFLLYSPTLA